MVLNRLINDSEICSQDRAAIIEHGKFKERSSTVSQQSLETGCVEVSNLPVICRLFEGTLFERSS